MNITTATPAEIDTRLAELYRQAGAAEAKVLAAAVTVHYALGEKATYLNRKGAKSWPTTDAQAIEAARARGDERAPLMYGGRPLSEFVAKYDAAAAALEAIEAEMAPLNAEYARRPWSRFFTVQQHNGHIHSGMNCSTCNRGHQATSFGWNPDLSGLTEAEAVAKLGPSLCTVCFPSAPVEWTIGADKKADQCDGSRKAPIEGSTSRTGMNVYGDCTKCTARPIINADGTVRAHKPKEPREQAAPAAPAAPEAPAPAAAPEAPAAEAAPAVEPGAGELLAEPHPDTLRMLEQIAAAPAGTTAVFDTAGRVEYIPSQEENPAMLLPEIPVTLLDLDAAAARYSDATHGTNASDTDSRAAAIEVADLTTRAILGHQVADLLDAIADRRAAGAPAGEILDQVVDALSRLAGIPTEQEEREPAPGDEVAVIGRDGGLWTVDAIRERDGGRRYLSLTRRDGKPGQSYTSLGFDQVQIVRRAADRDDIHQQAPHLSAYETHGIPVDGGYRVDDLRHIAGRVGVRGAGAMNKGELIHTLNGRLAGQQSSEPPADTCPDPMGAGHLPGCYWGTVEAQNAAAASWAADD